MYSVSFILKLDLKTTGLDMRKMIKLRLYNYRFITCNNKSNEIIKSVKDINHFFNHKKIHEKKKRDSN